MLETLVDDSDPDVSLGYYGRLKKVADGWRGDRPSSRRLSTCSKRPKPCVAMASLSGCRLLGWSMTLASCSTSLDPSECWLAVLADNCLNTLSPLLLRGQWDVVGVRSLSVRTYLVLTSVTGYLRCWLRLP
jgi:hypothetical protein